MALPNCNTRLPTAGLQGLLLADHSGALAGSDLCLPVPAWAPDFDLLESSAMHKLLKELLKDQRGMILSSEVVLIGTILVLGSIVGLAAVSQAVTHELNDVANACVAHNGYAQHGHGSRNESSGGNSYQITDSEGVPEVAGY